MFVPGRREPPFYIVKIYVRNDERIDFAFVSFYNNYGEKAAWMGALLVPTIYLQEEILMQVNAKTAMFVLELIGTISLAAAGIVGKYYIETSQS